MPRKLPNHRECAINTHTHTKVLFVAEAATLAHVARPLVLSAALDRNRYDVVFACDPRYAWLLRDFRGRHAPIKSITTEAFLDALSRGRPVYDAATLGRYVEEDLALLDEVRPSVVIGDFRLSLSISARLREIPYISVSNCYWSPYWRPQRYPMPSLRPLTTIVPHRLAEVVFRVARPLAFALHCRPLNEIRRNYGLPSLGSDLRRVYTDADHVLYADIEELFPEAHLPATHHFLGPLPWSPPLPTPDWWDKLPADRPVVYVTMGSSGQAAALPHILRALGHLDITVIAASAGRELPENLSTNIHVAAYLPGDEASRRAQLVICNGGSPTSYQALSAGVPVIGIPSNLDQFLNMETLKRAGVGTSIPADRLQPSSLAKLAHDILNASTYAAAARALAHTIQRYDLVGRFNTLIEAVVKGR